MTEIDLRDLPLPLFDQDVEEREGLPPNARKLQEVLKAHDGLLIASPEYNSSISGVLKNAIDWASRAAPGEMPLAGFVDKVAVIMSASPGGLGGLRGLVHLRMILGNIHVLVLPDQMAIARAQDAFQSDGRLKDTRQHAAVEQLGATLTHVLRKLKAS